MLRRLRFVRLVSVLSIAFVLISVTNLDPSLFGGLERVIVPVQSVFVGLGLSALALLGLWWSGLWRKAQSTGRSTLVEIGVGGCLLVAFTFAFGVVTTPFHLCFGGSGGYACYPDVLSFSRGVFSLISLVMAEELFFRAYLINELNQAIKDGSVGALASALLYSAYHLPALWTEGSRAFSAPGLLLVVVGAVSLSLCYWYTGRNLLAVLLLHGYWDGIGALLVVPYIGVSGPIIAMLGQLTAPVVGVVAVHQLLARRTSLSRGRGKIHDAVPKDARTA
ncbi:MAG: CPBP family intramembrane metalloprotease [Nitrososphaerales archaeon]|nr:CPBP family intramembrane metalloprotease [Nitrososphaerales archaeon]